MVTIEALRKVALSFPEVTEEPHFEKTSFRVKKKIFATYDSKKAELDAILGLLLCRNSQQITPYSA